MSAAPTTLTCAGCGTTVDAATALPFRCPAARPGDDVDHVLGRSAPPSDARWPDRADPNPFVRFRELLASYQVARARGLSDADYVALVRALDAAVAEVDGHGFATTPCVAAPALAVELGLTDGELWIKNETVNVSGSHKARHLMGIAVYLAVAERTGAVASDTSARPLAIASCGNAALAAAVVARAAGRSLRVFIPTWADANVVARLRALDAELVVCERREGDPPGDPCYLQFRAAVERGALPFTCQGNENGMTIEGGMTLAWELVDQLEAPLDRLVVQVGGGALASGCSQGLRWAHALGALPSLPALHTVQTLSGHPLLDAWRTLIDGAVGRQRGRGATPISVGGDRARIAWLAMNHGSADLLAELDHARTHRAAYMRPVAEAPCSVATGILDDETYDWLAVADGMIRTGGWPVAVTEERLVHARDRGRATTGILADATGTAGLAGALELAANGALAPTERVAVLFTGIERGA